MKLSRDKLTGKENYLDSENYRILMKKQILHKWTEIYLRSGLEESTLGKV